MTPLDLTPLTPLDIALAGGVALSFAAVGSNIVAAFAILAMRIASQDARRHHERADKWRDGNDFWRRQAGDIDDDRAALSERVATAEMAAADLQLQNDRLINQMAAARGDEVALPVAEPALAAPTRDALGRFKPKTASPAPGVA